MRLTEQMPRNFFPKKASVLMMRRSRFFCLTGEEVLMMNSIPRFDDPELEARISNVVATTTALVANSKSARRVGSTKVKQKKQLRQAFADLAELKARRTLSVIHKLDCEIGLGELA